MAKDILRLFSIVFQALRVATLQNFSKNSIMLDKASPILKNKTKNVN